MSINTILLLRKYSITLSICNRVFKTSILVHLKTYDVTTLALTSKILIPVHHTLHVHSLTTEVRVKKYKNDQQNAQHC